MNRIRLAALAFGLFAGLNAHAQSIPLDNVNNDGMNKVVGDFSANFLHTSVSGASSLGHVFGFEVGAVVGQTATPHLSEVANEIGQGADASKLYYGELLGVLSVPAGLTVEVGLVPKVGSSSFKYDAISAALKWTPTELFLDLPFSLAGKISYTQNTLNFSQTIQALGSTPVDYTYTNKETAFMILASKDFMIVEPYIGLGYVSAKGTLSATSQIFDPSFTTDTVASGTRSGGMWMVGTEVKLVVAKLGIEYMNLFNTGRVAGKFSLYF